MRELAHTIWPAFVVIAPLAFSQLLHNAAATDAIVLGTGLVMAGLSLTRFAPQGDGKSRPRLAAYFATFASLIAATSFFRTPLWAVVAVPVASVAATLALRSEVKDRLTD